jgi:pimeloyl-ACP methyl ester carboxylesterase
VATTLSASLVACTDDGAEPELPAEPLSSESPTTGSAPATPRSDLSRYYEQPATWRGCRSTMECTQIEVPLDYADPTGEAITLSVLRVPATNADQRIGSLVVNPGGPGGSGVDYAAAAETYFGAEVRAAFDIVGFDPRGVGESTPLDCASDAELDELVASDPDPDSRRESRAADALLADLGTGCLDRSGDLARHMSTEEAARDIDILRAVLDQQRLVFFGASYGTYLGATYADLFPGKVGRMVLDGAIDPTASSVEAGLVQAEGFEVALRAYVEACQDRGSCFLGGSVEESLTTIRNFLEDLDADPIPGGGNRVLTQGNAVLGVWAPLYNEDFWPVLDAGLSQALGGNGQTLLSISDQYVSRGPNGYLDNSVEALYAVNCLDPHDEVSLRESGRLEHDFLEVSPTFGRIFAFGLTACGAWPIDTDAEKRALKAAGADPILVIGTSRDPATPLRWAEALADQLESGVLVRRDGDGHTGYRAGNQCVDDIVERYLVSGEVPADDVDC